MIRCAVAPKLRNVVAIMFENILVLRTSQQSLVKRAQNFSKPVAVLYCCFCTFKSILKSIDTRTIKASRANASSIQR